MSVARELEQIVTVRAPAKVNLTLRVGALGEDGYHPLETVYQAIGLYDDVTVVPSDEWQVEVGHVGETSGMQGISLAEVPLDDRNIAVRAGRLLADFHGFDGCASITIAKGIPVAAGMAGGSADAAATLVALDRLWELQTSDDDLLRLAAQLGSDVPFALLGGTAYGTGHGERVQPIAASNTQWYVVVPHAGEGLSTAAVYAEFDADPGARPPGQVSGQPSGQRAGQAPVQPAVLPGDAPLRRPDELIGALTRGEPLAAPWLRNDLTAAAFRLMPQLRDTVQQCQSLGAGLWMLSGSGPTLLFLAQDHQEAQQLRAAFIDAGLTLTMAAPGPVAGAHVVDYV